MRESNAADLNVVLATEYGSTAFGMAHAASDRDIFLMFAQPTRDLLDGTFSEAIRANRSRAIVRHNYENCDQVEAHEIGSAVHLLLQGNINLVQYVLSPVVVEYSQAAANLRRIVTANLSKNIFHSAAGMQSANMKRYAVELMKHETPFSSKKAGQIVRNLEFAIRILDGRGAHFLPVYNANREQCEDRLDDLKNAYADSSLPESPDPQPFREWLFETRMAHLDRQL